jgi:threonine/homoserine/homoserine lactone efflux protein
MTTSNFLLYTAAALILIMLPGPDTIYIATRGITQGRAIALVSALGVCSGYLIHTLLVMFGLSALLQTSEMLFNLLRYAGGAYLVYLGTRVLFDRQQFDFSKPRPLQRQSRLFWQGMLTSVTNPKSSLFFLAFLPQFVVPSAGHVPLQMLLLGLTWTVLCVIVYSLLAFFSGALGNRLAAAPRFGHLMRWLSGSVFIALGLRLAIVESR